MAFGKSVGAMSAAAAGLMLLVAVMMTPIVAADDGTWQVEFTVQLKKGETGTFVVEVHPDWWGCLLLTCRV